MTLASTQSFVQRRAGWQQFVRRPKAPRQTERVSADVGLEEEGLRMTCARCDVEKIECMIGKGAPLHPRIVCKHEAQVVSD